LYVKGTQTVSKNASAVRPASLTGLVFLVAIVLAVPSVPLAPFGLAQASPARARKGKSIPAAKDFEYELSDCLESERKDSLGLIVSDDSVSFDHVFTMNCIAATKPDTVRVLYAKKGQNLEVSVVLRAATLSDCTCPIGIQGKIANLTKGTYRLSFVYDAQVGNAVDAKPTRQSLGGKEFTIR
jgi:hypothetical protein